MAQLSNKEQAELNKLLKENESIQSRIDKGINVQNRTLEKQEQIQKRIGKLQEKQNEMSSEQRDVQKEANKLLEQLDKKQRILNLSADKFKSLKSKTYDVMQTSLATAIKHNKETGKGNNLLKAQVDAMGDLAGAAGDIESLKSLELEYQDALLEAQKEGNTELQNHYNKLLEIANIKQEEAEQIQAETEAMDGLDDLMGGFLKSSIEFLKASPIARGIAAGLLLMKQLSAALQAFSDTARGIGESFGAAVLQDFGSQIGMATAEAKLLGYEAADVNSIITKLNSEFGMTVEESNNLVGAVTNVSKALGVSVSDGASLVQMFGKLSGESAETAEGVLSAVNELARAEGVAPSAVMGDIAQNAEFFAKFSKSGGRNVAETALQARKLGLSLSTIEGMMGNATDLASSLSAEYEAELFLQKDLNLERLRAARLEGDTATVLAETVRLAGSREEFDRLSAVQKEKLAAALQTDVVSLQKIVNAEDRRKKLIAGTIPLSERAFSELVGQDALDGLSLFNNSLSTLGAILTQTIIPPIASVVGYFGELIALLTKSKTGMAILSGTVTALGAAFGILAVKGVTAAIALAWKAAGLASVASLGFGTLAAAGIAAAFIAGIYMSMQKAKDVGDMMSIASGKTVVSTKEGGLFSLSPNDDFVAAPGIASAMAGGGTSVDMRPVSNEISSLKEEISKTNQAIGTLISNMEGYFGFGGSAVKGIGRETIKAGTSIL